MQIALQAASLERAVGRGIQPCVLPAVADVDRIDVVHQFHGLLFADIFIKRAAEIVRQVVFSVRKRPRATEAVHDRTRRTADAVLDRFAVNGTFAFFERRPSSNTAIFFSGQSFDNSYAEKIPPGPAPIMITSYCMKKFILSIGHSYYTISHQFPCLQVKQP